jgi:hypothetical protein
VNWRASYLGDWSEGIALTNSGNCRQAALGEWVNQAVSVDDALENAVSTSFLEHARQVGIDRVLGPYLNSKAKDKSHP